MSHHIQMNLRHLIIWLMELTLRYERKLSWKLNSKLCWGGMISVNKRRFVFSFLVFWCWSDLRFLFLFCSTRTLWWSCWSPTKSLMKSWSPNLFWGFHLPSYRQRSLVTPYMWALLFSWHDFVFLPRVTWLIRQRLAVFPHPQRECGHERASTR